MACTGEDLEVELRLLFRNGILARVLRLTVSTVRTNLACLSPSTLSPNLESLGSDCDSGAQFAPQDPEMASMKLEDCS